jgi:type I restriction enzyme M protein
LKELEKRLWDAADELRANSKLESSEYSEPVLGLIFLKFADVKFQGAKERLEEEGDDRFGVGPEDYHAEGVLYLPEGARYERLVGLPEGADVGQEINDVMKAIEEHNPDLKGVLPADYHELNNPLLFELLRNFNSIPMDIEGDIFGKIFEYFLGKFALQEGKQGGQFYTPTSIVKLIVEMIEPYHGRIYDPAAGSGGMFVQSARFVEEHQKNPSAELAIFGEEKTDRAVRLAKMNLAAHGLSGDIQQGNSYYNDIHDSVGRFDFVMANPPFNVDRVDKEKLKDDPRFPFGMPSVDNANYLWIQMFYSALGDGGRSGFVMANSAADARHSEREIRRQLIEDGAVDAIIAVGSNFFYTVTLPCTLWFLDRGKAGTDREDRVLFIDARDIYRQIDRAHRDFKPEQIEFLANIGRLYRGEDPEFRRGSEEKTGETFPDGEYADVPGLCAVATIEEIEEQDWSLNPGRYVGVKERKEDEDFDFEVRLTELDEEFELLTADAHELEERISENIQEILSDG